MSGCDLVRDADGRWKVLEDNVRTPSGIHRAPVPTSAAAGLSLPEAVRLLQPVMRCWGGRCQTCHQPVDLGQLVLFHRRE